MKNYDSHESRKLEESLDEKTRIAREWLGNQENKAKIMDALKQMGELVTVFAEKAKYSKLDKEELAMLDKAQAAMIRLSQQMSDSKLLLLRDMSVKAEAYYFHVKKLAEEGNEDAKKVYERLKPLYQNTIRPASTMDLN